MEPVLNVNDNQPELRVIIVHSVIAFTVSDRYIRRDIPADGFNVEEMRDMSTLLGVNHAWLAEQLTRPEIRRVAGPDVIAWLQRNRSENRGVAVIEEYLRIRTMAEPVYRNSANQLAQQPNVTRGIVQVDSVTEDEVCAVCLEEKKDDPSLPWAIATGCTRHKFHRKCLEQWHGNKCITCRAELHRA